MTSSRMHGLPAVLAIMGLVFSLACQPRAATPTQAPPAAAPTSAPAQAPKAAAPAATAAPVAQAAQATALPKPAPAQKVEPQGKITIGLSVNATTMDPAMVSDQTTTGILANVFDSLLARKTGSMEPVPMLAESYKLVNDTTWEFKLRKGVKFHNGEDFTADAVKFTLDRNIKPEQKAPQRSFIAVIKEVKVVDPYTVHIITDGPSPTLPNRMTTLTSWILPPKSVQEKGDAYFASNPIGTGPYKFVDWVKDDRVTLEANPNYWAGPPAIKTMVFKPMPEASARIAAIQTGAVDVVANVPADQAAALKNSQGFSIQAVPSMLVVYLGIDSVTDSPTAKKEVRQAINLAVDRETIVKDILRGFAKLSTSSVSDEVFGFDSSLKPYPYDPAKAKQLLTSAGYPDGFPLNIHGPNGRYSMDRDVLQAVAGYLQKVGIKAKVQTHEWGEYNSTMKYGTADKGAMYMLGWGGSGTFIPELAIYPLVKSGEVFSTTKDAQLDSLMDSAMRSMDSAKRADLWKQVQQRIHDEAYRFPLFQQYYIYGVSNKVQNWDPRGDEYVIMKDITTGKDVTLK
ncbi:MAG: ABC transporter substrate-binding protein [Chloroflexi bacterium]|nr:ABC transporter substrate-binding protein [Chloroflexota bacterium]